MCKICETKPVYEFTNQRKLCQRCYIQWFEKKFLYTIRKFKMIDKGDKIFIPNSEDICVKVLQKLVKDYAQRGTIKLVKVKKDAKILSFKTADDFAIDVITFLLRGNEKDIIKIGKDKKEKHPLFLFLKKEVVLYARLKDIKGKREKNPTKIGVLLEEMEKKHPEVKNAVIQSYVKYYTE